MSNRKSQVDLQEYVRAFDKRRVLVVGDAIADQFLYGRISRVSREAPVLILKHERTETTPGGAANCAANLASLGAHCALVARVGDDILGAALVEKLRACNVDRGSVLVSPGTSTTTKVRILAGQSHSPRQQVIRVDYEDESSQKTINAKLRERLRKESETADVIIISDYNYGVVDDDMIAAMRDVANTRRIPVVVDSRFGLARFPGFTSATPNEDEVEKVVGRPLSDLSSLEAAGKEVLERLNYTALLVTRGNKGMVLFERGAGPVHIEAVGGQEPVDVTGAGDTVIAAYTLAIASGAGFSDAARIANHAGGLVVMKRGTATVSGEELLSSIKRWA